MSVTKPKALSMKAHFDIDEEISVDVSWDKASELVEFLVEMPVGCHLAFGFGSKLEACDMLLIQADMEESKVLDCFYSS